MGLSQEMENEAKAMEEKNVVTVNVNPVVRGDSFVKEKSGNDMFETQIGMIKKLNQSFDYVSCVKKSNKVLGTGTFGTVYQGHLKVNDIDLFVAIKEINLTVLKGKIRDSVSLEQVEEVFENQKKKIQQEIDLLKTLNHKNVIKYFASDVKDEMIIIVTELATQGTLEEVFKVYQEEDVESFCKSYFLQVIKGLSYLHSKGIIHRDIKPMNLLMKEGVVKIADIGISKVLDKETTDTSLTTIATFQFMPIEFKDYCSAIQNFGKTSKSTKEKFERIKFEALDIYSVGITFLYLLLGKFPNEFRYDDDDMKPVIPDQIKDKKLRDLIISCLKYEPDERPSANDLLEHEFFL